MTVNSLYSFMPYSTTGGSSNYETGMQITNMASQMLQMFFSAASSGGNNYNPTVTTSSPKTSSKKTATEEPAPKQEEDSKAAEEAVKKAILDYNSLGNGLKTDLIKKYNAMKAVNPDITDAEVSRRLNQYKERLKAKDLNDFENQLAQGTENTFYYDANIDNAIKNNDLDAYKKGYTDLAKSYIENYENTDTQGAQQDGAINFSEFLAKEMKDIETRQHTESLSDEEVAEMKDALQASAYLEFKMLDTDGNNVLDNSEMASMLYTMSRYNDTAETGNTGAIITQEEHEAVQNVLADLGLKVLTIEDKTIANDVSEKIQNGNLAEALIIMKDNGVVTQGEIDSYLHFLKAYTENQQAFM